jgi:hypothetical protein
MTRDACLTLNPNRPHPVPHERVIPSYHPLRPAVPVTVASTGGQVLFCWSYPLEVRRG